jgi:STE24 endopeptidase
LGADHLGDNSPETIERILRYFGQEDIELGSAYSKAGFPVYISFVIFKEFLLFGFLWSGYSIILEDYCLQLGGTSRFLRNAYFFGIIFFANFLIGLPFSYYFGFHLEHEFGFSNMSFGFWVWTKVKSTFLNAFFTIIGAIIVSWVISSFKKTWFLIVPIGGLLVGLFTILIYPIVILPLFYDLAPIQEGSLKESIAKLTQKTGIEFSEINIIKESEYSNHTNAFFTGYGSKKRIYLYDTLIQKHSEKEVISVLAHEIGHWEYDHNLKGIVLSFISSLGLFWILHLFFLRLQNSDLPIKSTPSPTNLIYIYFLFQILNFFINPIESIVSREMERNADYYALEVTGDPETFISSEIKMAKDNKSRLNPHPWTYFFWHSHPSTMERIEMGESFQRKEK